MKPLDYSSLAPFLAEHIEAFHAARAASLQKVELATILARKNPYLYRAKNLLTAEQLVRSILDAHISSQEETLFGTVLEKLAIFVNAQTHGGRKSSSEGIDLEFTRDNIVYIVAIKSGPNWGNSSQIARMLDNFRRASRVLNTNTATHVVPVNGCCYGRDAQPDKPQGYRKLCGQAFWEFVSGDPNLYTAILEPLGHKARERNDAFLLAHAQVVNRFTAEFASRFCRDGMIDWNALVAFNSSKIPVAGNRPRRRGSIAA